MYFLCRSLFLRCGANFQSTLVCLHENINAVRERAFSVAAGNSYDRPDSRPRQTQLTRYAMKFHKPGDYNINCSVYACTVHVHN